MIMVMPKSISKTKTKTKTKTSKPVGSGGQKLNSDLKKLNSHKKAGVLGSLAERCKH